MTTQTTSSSVPPSELPATIRTYLAAHASGDAPTAAASFAETAVVVDDGTTYRGSAEVLTFLSSAGAEFSYTTKVVGAERTDDAHWVVHNRLEGDFPGGVAELAYRFTVAGDKIAELTIAP